MVAALTVTALAVWDRGAPWLRHLGWSWGIALVLLVVGPWALAETVASDGAFWSGAVMGDMVSKLQGARESHGAPPGLHLLLAPLLLFPAGVLLPAALVHGWKARADTGVRFALCWLAPAWIVFELAPTKLPHYPLPLYGALAWLLAAALSRPIGAISRFAGAALGLIGGVALAGVAVALAVLYGGDSSRLWAGLTAALVLGAAAAGVVLLFSTRRAGAALLLAGGLGVLGHDALAAGLAPSLQPLWVSPRVAEALKRAGIDPRNGVTPGPVAVAGYGEPSMVFLLGAHTELGEADDAASAISDGRPAIVEARQRAAFLAALKTQDGAAAPAGEVKGLDYSTGKPVDLFLYRSLETAAGQR